MFRVKGLILGITIDLSLASLPRGTYLTFDNGQCAWLMLDMLPFL